MKLLTLKEKMQTIRKFCCCLLVFPFLLEAQSNQNVVVRDTVDVTYTVYEHFSDIHFGSAERERLQLSFDTISVNQFNEFSKEYTPRIDTSAKRIANVEGDFFQLIAADTAFVFRCKYDRPWLYYHGYYPDLDSYLIGVSGDEIYETFFIERTTAKGLPVPPLFDASGNNPLISPDKKKMLIYETCGYDRESCLKYQDDLSAMALVDLSHANQLYDLNLTTWRIFATKDWKIDKLIWIDGKNIALKIFEDTDREGNLLNVRYLKTEVK